MRLECEGKNVSKEKTDLSILFIFIRIPRSLQRGDSLTEIKYGICNRG